MTVNLNFPAMYRNIHSILRNHDFGGASFDLSNLSPLYELVDRGVEHEFVDDELERLRITFVKAAREFLSFIARHTFPRDNHSDRYLVVGHWWPENPESPEHTQREVAVKDLNESATATAEAYDALVRRARRKLAP